MRENVRERLIAQKENARGGEPQRHSASAKVVDIRRFLVGGAGARRTYPVVRNADRNGFLHAARVSCTDRRAMRFHSPMCGRKAMTINGENKSVPHC